MAKKIQNTRYTANELLNGNFDRLPFRYKYIESDVMSAPSSYGPAKKIFWVKERIKESSLLTTNKTNEVLPGWRVWCSVDEGASLVMDPLDFTTGHRTWSKDGGYVAAVTFNQKCEVYFEQDLNSVNHLAYNYVTVSGAVYSMVGSPRLRIGLNFGETDDSIEYVSSIHCGNLGSYYRFADTHRCPGDIIKCDFRVVLSGFSGESVGVSGFGLCLGEYTPLIPYSNNPVQDTLPPGTIIFVEDDVCPVGYSDLGTDFLFYQTLGDPNTVDNVPASTIPTELYSRQYEIGQDNHNAHTSPNPFLETNERWYSDVAWNGRRVRNFDLEDRGSFSTAPALSGSVYWATKNRSISITQFFAWSGLFTGWTDLGIPAAFAAVPGGLQNAYFPAGSYWDTIVANFAKSIRTIKYLPAVAGYNWGGTEATYLDYWERVHLHLMETVDEMTLPPYRGYRACTRI